MALVERELLRTPTITVFTLPIVGLPTTLMRFFGFSSSNSEYIFVFVTSGLLFAARLRRRFSSVSLVKSMSSMFSSGHTALHPFVVLPS